jgi:hypothetical protein
MTRIHTQPIDPHAAPECSRASDTVAVVRWTKHHNLPAELVGRWVWVTFTDKPAPEIRAALIRAGFRYSGKRRAWAHWCCVAPKRRGCDVDPRSLHGSIGLSDIELD